MWKIRQRLLREELERLSERLSGDKPPKSAAMIDHTVRLLTIVAMLIRQHHINTGGQCNFCGCARFGWRFWRPRCTVLRTATFAMDQSVDVVWWQLFTSMGRERSLAEVREWVTGRNCESRNLGVHDEDETSRSG